MKVSQKALLTSALFSAFCSENPWKMSLAKKLVNAECKPLNLLKATEATIQVCL